MAGLVAAKSLPLPKFSLFSRRFPCPSLVDSFRECLGKSADLQDHWSLELDSGRIGSVSTRTSGLPCSFVVSVSWSKYARESKYRYAALQESNVGTIWRRASSWLFRLLTDRPRNVRTQPRADMDNRSKPRARVVGQVLVTSWKNTRTRETRFTIFHHFCSKLLYHVLRYGHLFDIFFILVITEGYFWFYDVEICVFWMKKVIKLE